MTFIKTKEIMVVEAKIGCEFNQEDCFYEEYEFPDSDIHMINASPYHFRGLKDIFKKPKQEIMRMEISPAMITFQSTDNT